MKHILFLIALLWSGGTIVNANVLNNRYEVIVLTANNKDDTSKDILKGKDVDTQDGPQTFGMIIQPVYASLYNKVVSVTFEETFSAATISIINEATGETVYTETYSNPASLNIDMSGESS